MKSSSSNYYYWWKNFNGDGEDEDWPEKPRRYGVTELRGSDYFLSDGRRELEDILDSMGDFVDGLKFSGGSNSLMSKDHVKEITELAHRHNLYVSTGDWAEHLLRKGPSSFKEYIEECKNLGFDTIELNPGSLKLPEDVLLRFIRLVKSMGLKSKPQLSMKFDKSEIPIAGNRAFGAYIPPTPQSSDVNLLVRKAERCLEAGADMIMIDADDVCDYMESLRADVIAKIITRLGLEKTMFEASDPKTYEWFIRCYGPRVNLFVSHSDLMNLECLRGRSFGRNLATTRSFGRNLATNLGSSFFLV